MNNSIKTSVYHLAYKNNGFWKSEKQATFLMSVLQSENCIGFADSGYNSCPIFVIWDNDGITQIYKKSKTKTGCKEVIVWERKIQGVHTAAEKREIKRLEKTLKEVLKSIADRDAIKHRYADIDQYNRSNARDLDHAARLQERLDILKNN